MFDLDHPNPVSQDLPPMPTERFGFAAVVYDSTNIIALGGAKSRQNLATVEIFDTIKCEWTQLPSMSTARNNFAAGVSGTSIIVAGGDNTNTCEIFDMQTKTEKFVKMNDTLVAGHGRGLKTLDLTAPNLIT